MRNKHNKPETYCIDCDNRTDRDVTPAYTNLDKFCSLGYTQNPRTFEATVQSFKNGSQICHRNPFKKKALMLAGA
jgi:hypothetical protein